MLSDEERKAIDYLQFCYDISTITNESLSKLGIVLNLIEKQSKEIEELKEENEKYKNPPFFDEENYISKEESEQKERKTYIKGTNDADELCNKKWENKIKAKIEELDEEIKVKREIAKNPMDRVSGRLLTDSIVELEKTKKVLQSLLEKE